jgi:hypothetical protein
MELLRLDTPLIASSMGEALAVIHWDAQTDGGDIEFAIGSSRTPDMSFLYDTLDINKKQHVGPPSSNLEDFYRRITQLYCLDFNQVHTITMDEHGVEAALNAFEADAPHYPRQLRSSNMETQAWDAFVKAYIVMAGNILEREDEKIRDLPACSSERSLPWNRLRSSWQQDSLQTCHRSNSDLFCLGLRSIPQVIVW